MVKISVDHNRNKVPPFIGRGWLLVLWGISLLPVGSLSQGTLSLSNALTYPRYNLQKNEDFAWRTQVFYTRQKTRFGDWNLRVGYLTPTEKDGQSIRLYAGYLKTHFGEKTTLKIGRFTEWKPLYLMRVDGLQLTRQITPRSTLVYLGGATPTNIPNDNTTSEKGTTHYLGWQSQGARNQLTLAVWTKDQKQQQSNFLGLSFRRIRKVKGYARGFVTWNLTHKRLQRLELLWTREFSPRFLMDLQLRYRSFLNSNPFPWSDESLPNHPVLAARFSWNVRPGLSWSHTLSSRLGIEDTDFTYTSTLRWPFVALNFISERHGITQSLGGLLSASHMFDRRLSVGGSLFYREYTYNREQSNFTSAGGMGWVTFQPEAGFSIRFNTQLFTNRLFNQDGRMGLTVEYVF